MMSYFLYPPCTNAQWQTCTDLKIILNGSFQRGDTRSAVTPGRVRPFHWGVESVISLISLADVVIFCLFLPWRCQLAALMGWLPKTRVAKVLRVLQGGVLQG